MNENLKKVLPGFSLLVLFFLSLFLYTKLAGPIPFSVSSITTNKNDVFTVTGEGKTSVAPDIAYVIVGVQASGSTVKQTQAQMNSAINKVTASLKGLGVEEKDIKTVNYSLNPNYDWNSGKQKIVGYSASTNLSIKIRDLDKVNEVIDQATGSGTNQVGGVSFDVEDKTKAEAEARKEAVAEAKKKAEEAARIAGFKLGKIINYSEGQAGYPVPMALDSRKMGLGAGTPPATEVQPGSSEITIVVSLSYQIE